MGITIHYKGKLNSPELTNSFLEEVEDIANSLEWECTFFPRDKKDEPAVQGVFIKPHTKSEFLQFMIDDNGYLRNASILKHCNPNEEPTFLNHIKTQFAPIEIHIAVIKLLKYIKKKYISKLEVFDEGDYWNTNDAHILKQRFDFLNQKLYEFGELLKEIEFEKKDTAESVVNKIETLLKKRSNKK